MSKNRLAPNSSVFSDARQRGGTGGGGGKEEMDLRVLHLQQLAEQHQVYNVPRQEASHSLQLREHLQRGQHQHT